MPCLRHNSTTGMPASPSLSTATIWHSVNLLFFKGVSDGKEAPKFYWLMSTLRGILRIQFERTKTGKARAVPISQEIQDEIFTHHAEHRNMGAIFTGCTGAFKEAIERAGIQL